MIAGRQINAYIVSAFLRNGTGGSPTGVVLDAYGFQMRNMQTIANRIGVSHTAFVFEPRGENDPVFIRFFTPGGEILNCGHGTIAAHYCRARKAKYQGDSTILQQTKDGIQQIQIINSGNEFEIFLKQNEIRFSSTDESTKNNLSAVLNISKADLDIRFPLTLASPGSYRFLLAVKSGEIVNAVQPNMDELKSLCVASKSMGCFVYSVMEEGENMSATARMFAPTIGVNEDIINGNS
jgi:PhzF family phenazine biosynthesis protein